MEPLVVESCNSTWEFDTDGMRFRRILKGIEVEDNPVATHWRTYYGLEVSEDSHVFIVLLNPEGTRLIRSWRHTDGCPQCGLHVASGSSRTDIASALA